MRRERWVNATRSGARSATRLPLIPGHIVGNPARHRDTPLESDAPQRTVVGQQAVRIALAGDAGVAHGSLSSEPRDEHLGDFSHARRVARTAIDDAIDLIRR